LPVFGAENLLIQKLPEMLDKKANVSFCKNVQGNIFLQGKILDDEW